MIVSTSFKGGFADKAEQVRSAAATMRNLGPPHYFITFTTSPEWPEIKRELLPGQTAYDNAELVNRIFKLKLIQLLKLLPAVFESQVSNSTTFQNDHIFAFFRLLLPS
jgi:hypothetical protein